MVKILIGLIAAIVIAAGGLFGFEFYVQHRVAGEVEAAFETDPRDGRQGEPRQGVVRPVEPHHHVADIAAESAAQPPVSVKIASFTASGVSQPDPTRFSADSIEATDVEVGATMAARAGWRLTYQAPRIARQGLFRAGRPAATTGSVVRRRPVSVRARAASRP